MATANTVSKPAYSFAQSKVTESTNINDADFRYAPNRICSECRTLLTGLLESYNQHGSQSMSRILSPYSLAGIRESAWSGCHLCALFEATFAEGEQGAGDNEGPLRNQDSIYFNVQPVRPEQSHALFALKPQADSETSSWNASMLHVYATGCEKYDAQDESLFMPETSLLSLGRSTGDMETRGLAKHWLEQCLSQHELCAANEDVARVVRPARLLSLSQVTSIPEVKLIDTAQAGGEPYVTLSHCWGKSPILRLLKATELDFRTGIDFHSLTNTFRDAIKVTLSLGYRFIWIDSLCIIQDSRTDWETQARTMALVYANSVFTIAALKSSAGAGGCFAEKRNPLGLRPLHADDLGVSVVPLDIGSLWAFEVDRCGYWASPLHTRAWVLQERFSSPRTLYYGARGIFWECRCMEASELHSRILTRDEVRNRKTWLERLETATDNIPFPSSAGVWSTSFQDRWGDLLNMYTDCQLTHSTDKIIALQSMVSEIERRSKTGKKFILGLWSHDLVGTALWYRANISGAFQGVSPVGRLVNSMPSWSWASVEGRIRYQLPYPGVEWEVDPNIDESSKTMSFRTWRRQVIINENEAIALDPDDPKINQRGWGGDLDEDYSWWADCGMPANKSLWIVLMQLVKISEKPVNFVARCLLITPSLAIPSANAAVDNHFARTGLVLVRFSSPRDNPFKMKDHDAQEVIILE